MVSNLINIPRYQVSEELYNGSRTLVYRGYREADHKPVVIKVLKNPYPAFSELVQFRNQYTIAKNLNSPLIIQTYSLESYQNGYVLVMEDFGGISLKEYFAAVETGYIASLQEFLEIAIALCNTLDILYRERIIHKDIKPANILINPETKQVKLIDFSIASLLPRETQTLVNPNVLEGTLAYISPEQTGRMNRGIDYRTDFYSLGVTFYELLTGELPFQSNEPMELVHCHIAKAAPLVHENNRQIPSIFSDIVNKLMAKNAEDRYQSALGLKFDLENCLHQLQVCGNIDGFEIASRDVCDRFIIPDKLYGRETEVETLLQAFERVSLGATEMMLVAGFSGIGKTAVVNEVHKPIVRQRGYFIKGKFDQFQRHIPFSAFVQAFRDLMEQLLTENDLQIQQWKKEILLAVGENGQVIIEVIPELEKIIGKQPPAPELSGIAAQNRFNLLFQKFTQVFTNKEHPLVIFLDDLQWADSASLKLIELLIADTAHLLIVGAYRDNEVTPVHPFMLTLSEIAKTSATINTITLAPLHEVQVNQLVVDTLKCAENAALPLSQLIFQKTQGNPFFVTQFLKALHQDKFIQFNLELGCWQCEITQVTQLAVTDDVVDFMTFQLKKLPKITQDVMQLAACIGNSFDLTNLAIISEKSEVETAAYLWKALQEGLVLPSGEVYKFYQQESLVNSHLSLVDELKQMTNDQGQMTITYKFLHDRVQQAAYSLICDDQKQATHLKIGRLFQQNLSQIEKEDQLFDIVGHLNIGIELITQPNEREDLAKLNLAAGQKAKNSTAYSSARNFVQTGLELLTQNCWQNQYELTLNLYVAAAETAYLNADLDGMAEMATQVLQSAKTILDKVKIYETQILALTSQSQMLEAIAVGQQALVQLGVEFSSEPDAALTGIALQTIAERLQGKQIQELVNLPVMSNQETIAAMQLLTTLFAPIFQAKSDLLPLLCSTMVSLSLQFGNAPASTIGYTGYGMVLCVFLGEVEKGYSFGRVGLSLLERLDVRELKCIVLVWFASCLQHRQEALRAVIPTLKNSYLAGMETGDFLNAGYSTLNYFAANLLAGVCLDDWEPEMENYCVVFARLKQGLTLAILKITQQVVHNWRETVNQPDLLIGTAYDETVMIPKHYQDNELTAIANLYIYKLMLAYFFGNYNNALDYITQAKLYLIAIPGLFHIAIFHFYAGLTYLAKFSTLSEIEQANSLALAETHQTNLAEWAHYTPMNYQHQVDLIEAEKYRVLGKNYQAGDLYDRAISLAKANGYIQEEALANELAAKFYLDWGKEKFAALYMQEAYYCYARWGAKAKTNDLEKRYPQLLQPILQQRRLHLNPLETIASIAQTSNTSSTYSSSSSISDTLDFTSVLEASQTISSTIELDQLVASLTKIILENSGAKKSVLILPQAGNCQVRAITFINDQQNSLEPIQTILNTQPLETYQDIPINIVNYVKNTQKTVVINNCQTDIPGLIGEYMIEHQPQSVLCTPIMNQGNLIGILYLENKIASEVFTQKRQKIIQLLSSQAAISLENAQLFTQQQEKIREISQKEAEYRSIFESVHDGLSICDLETGNIIASNPTNCQMHGYSQEEWLHLKPQDFIHSDYLYLFSNFLENLRVGKEFSAQVIGKRKDGSYFDVEVKALPFLYKGKLHGLTIVRDISEQQAALRERQKAEAIIIHKSQELELALQDLQQAQLQIVQSEKMSALGNLVAGVAHEMNNPLGFISATLKQAKPNLADIVEHLKLYQESLENPSDEIKEHAEEIDLDYTLEDLPKMIDSMLIACDRLKNISTSLRTFSRADKDYKVAFNIHEGIDSTILILKHRLKANEQRPAIEVITEYGNLPQIECFPGQLNQVFMNILANAIDALDESNRGRNFEEIKSNPNRIIIKTSLKNQGVEIAIADNGQGMNEEVKQKIFDHLFTTKGVGKGTGLGLAIARQIIAEKHGGVIEVNSQPGEGTEFLIQLPM
ncbi:AAA family ATPase [uncultured Nostoc sp.]|uniref:AAA family ATPase n=3 Tax=Nostoc TaxID=1177 RepID=UPI0035C9A1DC